MSPRFAAACLRRFFDASWPCPVEGPWSLEPPVDSLSRAWRSQLESRPDRQAARAAAAGIANLPIGASRRGWWHCSKRLPNWVPCLRAVAVAEACLRCFFVVSWPLVWSASVQRERRRHASTRTGRQTAIRLRRTCPSGRKHGTQRGGLWSNATRLCRRSFLFRGYRQSTVSGLRGGMR